jgi:hypothetical protein
MTDLNRDAWVSSLFKSIDEMDAEAFASFLTEDGTFKFGNGPVATGRVATEQAVAGFFGSIGGLKHTITGVWSVGSEMFVQGEVDYRRKSGTIVRLGFMNKFQMRGDKVQQYLVYADVTPIYNER